MTTLRYGNPPKLEDCVDIGTVPGDAAPKAVGNSGIFAGEKALFNEEVNGLKIPPHRRAWLTVAYYRKLVRSGEIPSPYVVQVPGLGQLVYALDEQDSDNWEVL